MRNGSAMKQKLKFFLSVILGNAMLAFAICAFVVPNDIMLGGSNGIALAVQHFIPVRLSVISAVVNVSLFLLGLVFMGWKFAAASLLSTIVYPMILAVFETLPLDTLFRENIVVSALFCGVLCGAGIGMVVRVGGSTGGMDIPPCILNKYKGIPVGTSLMFFDTAVVLLQVAIKGTAGILLSLLVIAVISFTVNKVVVSGEKKIEIIIISPEYQKIRREILGQIDCGVTMLDIETGYEAKKQQAILSVVYASKYPEIRRMALDIDKHAFIVAADVTNVNGKGYTLSRNPENN
ncbi:MAG: YitT family protein [Oscillospiraceae bacterium]|nr:YitT family protein [Oscillospiraceae bacterium]